MQKAKLYIDSYQSGMFRDEIECDQGENLYDVLTRHGFMLQGAVCRGGGVCRGCQVYIAEEGMDCLACRYTVASEELHVAFGGIGSEHSILLALPEEQETSVHSLLSQNQKVGVAFDLGTTTIAAAVVRLDDGDIVSQAGCFNRQAAYGADVVSRIQYAGTKNVSGESGLSVMNRLLREDIESLMDTFRAEGIDKQQICRLCFSGNTTMIHFLLNRSVEGLAQYPFAPETLGGERFSYGDMEIQILAGRSAFVGADIVSGVRYLGLDQRQDYGCLIDLGTNGEIWILNRDRGVCTSTSCGPAFANSVSKGTVHGTTLLEELAKAYKTGKVDSTGLLREPYFSTGIPCGNILITQDAVRQIQLAKAAILTGIELAAYELHLPPEEINYVALAGGFGFHLDPEAAFTLGMLPETFRGCLHIVGNTSLLGAVHAVLHPEEMAELPAVLRESRVLDLSMNKNFQEFFLHRLHF